MTATIRPNSEWLISVIIATYNRKELVCESIQSILDQTVPVHEIIVVSDGSSDGTKEYVNDKFAGSTPRVIVLEQPNLGESSARNRGISVASGNWLAFLDDDDLWHREKNEHTIEYLSKTPDCEAVALSAYYFCADAKGPDSIYSLQRDFIANSLEECHIEAARLGKPKNDFTYLNIRGNSYNALLERNRGSISTSTVQRETVIAAGCFPPAQDRGEDHTFALNVARLTEWHHVDKGLIFKRMHEGQQTHFHYGSIAILTGYLNAWYTGRPLPTLRVKKLEMLPELQKFSGVYLQMCRNFMWGAIKNRDWALAERVFLLGLLLLPRRRDQLKLIAPPSIKHQLLKIVNIFSGRKKQR